MSLPILEAGRMDYTQGEYICTSQALRGKHGISLRHEVTGDHLVSRLLQSQEAVFACDVSSPKTTYRRLHVCETGSSALVEEQEVIWAAEDVVAPVFFRPLIIARLDKPKPITLEASDGVHDIWLKSQITLQEGSILAVHQSFKSVSDMTSLLQIASDSTGRLLPGSYQVTAIQDPTFYFRVDMHPDLYQFVAGGTISFELREAILTGALIRALEILKQEHAEQDDWSSLPALRALAERLTETSRMVWDDENFKADVAATALKPIQFTNIGGDDD